MAFSMVHVILLINVCLFLAHETTAFNKYSEEANKPTKKKYEDNTEYPKSIRELDKPFRMSKLNVLWIKAKNRLTDHQLQSIFSDIKLHDKEEIAFKHYKAEGKDEDGLEEARLRKKLIGIMSTYGLLEHFPDTENLELLQRHKALNDGKNYVPTDVFDDVRLNKLWVKAEMAGFTNEELEALKEEFHHHQEKVDEYKSLLKDVQSGDPDKEKNSIYGKSESWNMLEHKEESNDIPNKDDEYLAKAKLLREKHLEIRNGYDHLDRLTAKGPNHREFIEPKVQGLWRIAMEANFPADELASLKEELLHYESRLLKLRHLHSEAALENVRKKGRAYEQSNSTIEQSIKKQARVVQKLHNHIETKIMGRHTEL